MEQKYEVTAFIDKDIMDAMDAFALGGGALPVGIKPVITPRTFVYMFGDDETEARLTFVTPPNEGCTDRLPRMKIELKNEVWNYTRTEKWLKRSFSISMCGNTYTITVVPREEPKPAAEGQLAVCFLIDKELDEVILTKRAYTGGLLLNGTCTPIGDGERSIDAAIRAVREDTGCDIKSVGTVRYLGSLEGQGGQKTSFYAGLIDDVLGTGAVARHCGYCERYSIEELLQDGEPEKRFANGFATLHFLEKAR